MPTAHWLRPEQKGLTMTEKENKRPVTVITKCKIRPGREKEFEAVYADFIKKTAELPGYLGVDVIRPFDHSRPEYIFILKFDSSENLKNWNESSAWRECLEKTRSLAREDLHIVHKVGGLEYWLKPPERPSCFSPPRYKMAIITISVAFPLAVILQYGLAPFIGKLNMILQIFITIVIFIFVMVYLLMPIATKLFSPWLFKHHLEATGG